MLLAFPVLGLRQSPAQERVFLCVRGRRGMPGSQMPVLTCLSTITSLSDPRRSWVWQTWTTLMFLPGVSCARLANPPAPASRSRKQGVLVTRTSTSVSRAVGSWVACNSASHVLTCHSNSDSRPTTLSSASRASLEQQAKQRRPTLLHLAQGEQ